MNRPQAIHALLAATDQAITALEAQLAETQRHAGAAPSAMESHSDTTRSQLQAVVINTRSALDGKRRMRAGIAGAVASADTSVRPGSLVTITDPTHGPLTYLVLDAGGGVETTVDGERVFVLGSATPLAKLLIGHQAGTTLMFRQATAERTLTIQTIA
ncbi:MAG: hypothetical protein Q7S84_00700 [bacterium]|nr:hypothetical protein [bacterium]